MKRLAKLKLGTRWISYGKLALESGVETTETLYYYHSSALHNLKLYLEQTGTDNKSGKMYT